MEVARMHRCELLKKRTLTLTINTEIVDYYYPEIVVNCLKRGH